VRADAAWHSNIGRDLSCVAGQARSLLPPPLLVGARLYDILVRFPEVSASSQLTAGNLPGKQYLAGKVTRLLAACGCPAATVIA